MTRHWLRGASRRARYVGLGVRPNRLYPLLSYLTGRREALERLTMRLPAAALRRTAPWPDADRLVAAALEGMPEPHSALLLYTGYYKASVFVGPVIERPGAEAVFWKAFRTERDAATELARAAALRRILPGTAVAPDCRSVGSAIVEYDCLARSPRRLSEGDLVDCALALGRSGLEQGDGIPSEPNGVAVSQVVADFRKLADWPAADLAAVGDELERVAARPRYLSHGDFTDWNAFRTVDGRLGIVDYDAVGYRPAYFDVVHLLNQRAAEKDVLPPVELLRSLLTGASADRTVVDLSACLLWDAFETMLQFVSHPQNRAALEETVRLKLRAWSQSRG
jgi:hypothetical protein